MMANRSFADENLPERVASSRCGTFTTSALINLGDTSFQVDDRHLCGPAGDVRLEPRVAQLLDCLARRRGEVVTRQTLLAEIWPNLVVGDDSLNRLVARLRRSFQQVDTRHDLVIETIPKSGYRLLTGLPKESQPAAASGMTRRNMLAIASAGFVGVAGLTIQLVRGGSSWQQERGRDAIAAMASAWESYDLVQIEGARKILSEKFVAQPDNRNLAGALAIASADALLAYPHTEHDSAALHTDLARSLDAAPRRDRAVVRALLTWRGDDWAEIDRALVEAPLDKHTLVARIRLLQSVGRNSEASELARALHQEQTTSPRRLDILLSLTLRRGDLSQAEKLLADALRYYEQHPSIWHSHFVSLALAGRFREAEEIFVSRGVAVAERAFPPAALAAWELTLAALARPDAAARRRAIDAAIEAPLQFQSATPESMLQLSLLLQDETLQADLARAYYTGDESLVRRARGAAHYPRLSLNFGMMWDRMLLPVRRTAAFADIAEATGLAQYWRRTGRFPDDRLAVLGRRT